VTLGWIQRPVDRWVADFVDGLRRTTVPPRGERKEMGGEGKRGKSFTNIFIGISYNTKYFPTL